MISALKSDKKYFVLTKKLSDDNIRLLMRPNIDKKFVDYSEYVKKYFGVLGLNIEDKGPILLLKWRKLHDKIENYLPGIYSQEVPQKVFGDLCKYCKHKQLFPQKKIDFRVVSANTGEILDLNFKDDFLGFVVARQKAFYNQFLKQCGSEINSKFSVLKEDEYKTKTELLDFKQYNKGSILKEIFSLYSSDNYLPVFLGDTFGVGDDEFAMSQVKQLKGIGIGVSDRIQPGYRLSEVKKAVTDAKYFLNSVSQTLPLLHKIVDMSSEN